MSFIGKIEKCFNSKAVSYIFFALAVLAYAFLDGAEFAYGWIAELYPFGSRFVPMVLAVTAACAVLLLSYIIISVFLNNNRAFVKNRVLRIIHIAFELIVLILFIYTFVLLFGIDKGITKSGFAAGLGYLAPNLPITGIIIILPLPLIFCESKKSAGKALIASIVAGAMIIVPFNLGTSNKAFWDGDKLPQIELESGNALDGAKITFESLKQGEKADALNLLAENDKCWTAQNPNGLPCENQDNCNNSVCEIQLDSAKTFNTAVIEEVGNQAQYFRLQAFVNDEWITVYQSEKIQSSRLCSFDTVTTDRVRLSIDKFRDNEVAVQIKSLRLYNEPKRTADNFEVTVYQRLDGDVPTEILARGEDYVREYAKFYDLYTTVIVFGAISWNDNGEMSFANGEESFAREIAALKKIISYRSDKEHEVKLIVTALADGAAGDHSGVNYYMSEHLDKVSQQAIELVEKYDFDGVDIDWEYPQSADDWKNYDSFVARLDEGINKGAKDKIISSALSAGNLGLSQETFDRLDQVQFMAYDGNDIDGYQSSLQQAQEGLAEFIKNGADKSKIIIGIAAYGRPINSTPYWAVWRNLEQANYWDSKYYNIADSNQIYEGTFCSPALAGDKTAYALFSGCGGVMVFRLGCDKLMSDDNSVSRGIKNAVDRYIDNF